MHSQNLARINGLLWINNAFNELQKANTRDTTNAWNGDGCPLNMSVGIGFPSMYSQGTMMKTVTIVKEAMRIDSKTLVRSGCTLLSSKPFCRVVATTFDMSTKFRSLCTCYFYMPRPYL
ncbi:hypothetical protein LOK49_LG06G01070 [Camellia lanceoleosa]|uniref:Uncharacterized protein n=1 Tax=Camellia lanceoleosa TaxID=1840588 RepID=A0ACC0HGH8_9ERIC|nr:hypothetical protein LOK49_LG06G01070 [Camellia lanceoleosa]